MPAKLIFLRAERLRRVCWKDKVLLLKFSIFLSSFLLSTVRLLLTHRARPFPAGFLFVIPSAL